MSKTLAISAVLSLLVVGLASCEAKRQGLGTITLSTYDGTKPTLDSIDESYAPTAKEFEILKAGTGKEVQEGDRLTINYTIFNMPEKSEQISTWDDVTDQDGTVYPAKPNASIIYSADSLDEMLFKGFAKQKVGTYFAVAYSNDDTSDDGQGTPVEEDNSIPQTPAGSEPLSSDPLGKVDFGNLSQEGDDTKVPPADPKAQSDDKAAPDEEVQTPVVTREPLIVPNPNAASDGSTPAPTDSPAPAPTTRGADDTEGDPTAYSDQPDSAGLTPGGWQLMVGQIVDTQADLQIPLTAINSDYPLNLPVVSFANPDPTTGYAEPTLDLNGWTAPPDLFTQDVYTGTGKAISAQDAEDPSNLFVVRRAMWVVDEAGDLTKISSNYADPEAASEALVGLLQGYQQAFVGHTIGSRFFASLPAELGFGEEGLKGDDGSVVIPANSTIYILADIINVV